MVNPRTPDIVTLRDERTYGVFMGLAIEPGVGLFTIYSRILDEETSDFCVTLVPNSTAAALPKTTETSPATGA
ncbi:MAG TPA: hypothetical protein VGP19_08410 [Candidatus Acidoferrales bacterium]|nr:hypothetical protein [Candidatus Acidoferrales bacterium]